MIFATSMFGACSSSDDNNTQKEEEKTQVATSGTLYVFEFLPPKAITWSDCSFVLKNGSKESTKNFGADVPTLANLTNAKLAAELKQKYSDVSLLNVIETLAAEYVPLIVDSVSLATFPSTVEATFKYAVKAGFDAKGEEQVFGYVTGCCFIDNLGKVQFSSVNPRVYQGIHPNNLSDFLQLLEEDSESKMSVTVSKDKDGLYLSSNKK